MNILFNPGVIIVCLIFFTFLGIVVKKLKIINKELLNLISTFYNSNPIPISGHSHYSLHLTLRFKLLLGLEWIKE